MMKRLVLVAALLLMLLCAAMPIASAAGYYRLGDTMDDFTAVLSDGTQVRLSTLLQHKQAVFINFWASWCPPCCAEFPAMEQAYADYADQVAVLALSVEHSDDNDVINRFKAQNGLSILPMGRDAQNLGDRFGFNAIPTSVLVDRNGVICWINTGALDDADMFRRLFAAYVGSSYNGPKLLEGIPSVASMVADPDEAALNAAINASGSGLRFTSANDPQVWPFMPDNGSVRASNVGVDDTVAAMYTQVTVRAGDVFTFRYTLNTEAVSDVLCVYVDGAEVGVLSGRVNEPRTFAWQFDLAGTYNVRIQYEKDKDESVDGEFVQLWDARLVPGTESAAVLAAVPAQVCTLSGRQLTLEPVSPAREVIVEDAAGVFSGYYGAAKLYVMPGSEGTFRVRVGQALDAGRVLFVGDHDYLMQNETMAVRDELGYLYTTALSSVTRGGYSNTYVFAYRDYRNVKDDFCILVVFASEEDLNFFCQTELLHTIGAQNVTWRYADGGLPGTDVVAQEADELPDGYAAYAVAVIDQYGAGVPGVMLQVCDESTCELMATDENGAIYFIKESYPYEIHVLAVPTGYSMPANVQIKLLADGGDAVLRITKE